MSISFYLSKKPLKTPFKGEIQAIKFELKSSRFCLLISKKMWMRSACISFTLVKEIQADQAELSTLSL